MNNEVVMSPNKEITAIVSGPHEPLPHTATFLLGTRGISPADTTLLSNWFTNPPMVEAVKGKFGYVKVREQVTGQTVIRVYSQDESYHELKVQVPANIDYFASIGRYFGYRECCAYYYSAKRKSAVSEKVVREENHLYVHCPECHRNLSPYDRHAVEIEIQQKRICPINFPFHRRSGWIRYELYDAVFRNKMSFALLRNNPFLQRRGRR